MAKNNVKQKVADILGLLPSNEDIQEFVKGKKPREVDGILFHSDEIIYHVYEEKSLTAVKLRKAALKALELCPVNSNAINILAGFADDHEASVTCYERSIHAASLVLGKKFFKEEKGHFWGFHETRPYMRALHGLAETLWEMGSHDKAIEQLNNMLGLNPNDNQGVRYTLAAWLVETQRFEELGKLLKEYKDDCQATWPYTTALLNFQKEGDSAKSRKLLKKAYETNKFVPAYILGNKKMPKELPDYMSFGDDSEAVAYAHYCQKGWDSLPKAKAWLKEALATL